MIRAIRKKCEEMARSRAISRAFFGGVVGDPKQCLVFGGAIPHSRQFCEQYMEREARRPLWSTGEGYLLFGGNTDRKGRQNRPYSRLAAADEVEARHKKGGSNDVMFAAVDDKTLIILNYNLIYVYLLNNNLLIIDHLYYIENFCKVGSCKWLRQVIAVVVRVLFPIASSALSVLAPK